MSDETRAPIPCCDLPSESTGGYDDPVDRITWRPAASLKANAYNPNMVMRQELRLLTRSLVKNGWIQPLLITPSGTIIDGFHRWRLAQEDRELLALYGGNVPCVTMDVSEAEAMTMTVRMNRAKGSHAAIRMSSLVQVLVREHGMDLDEVAAEIGATRDEVDLLLQDDLFLAKGLKDYRYSKSWIPREGTRSEAEDGS